MGAFLLGNAMNDTYNLNAGQSACGKAFLRFLLNPKEKEFIISGAAGTGKTYLMRYLADETMRLYADACVLAGQNQLYTKIQMTATTNKAAEVLAQSIQKPTSTIHSFLKLRVMNNYTTGKTELKRTAQHQIITNTVIFIDECSFIDAALYREIMTSTENCKIVYVGDDKQLAPIFEQISKVYDHDVPIYQLTEQMRNSGQQALMDLAEQMRETVRTLEFNPITPVPGVIDHITRGSEQEKIFHNLFTDPDHKGKVLAYTNNRVMDYNDYLRAHRGLGDRFVVGDNLVSNTAMDVGNGRLTIEQELHVVWVSDANSYHTVDASDNTQLEVYEIKVEDKYGGSYSVKVPVDYKFYHQLVAYYKNQKNWPVYYRLGETIPDLRPKDAATVHKAQGSTYDYVIIDLDDISKVRKNDEAARMLYVAITRAKHRIYLFGSLADKYGGIIDG